MAATSTNKQPLLIDRPLLRGAFLNNATPLVNNRYNPDLGSLVQLVRVGDIPSEDSALIESISFVTNDEYPDPSGFVPDVSGASGTYSGTWQLLDPITDNEHQVEVGIYVYAPNQANPATAQALMVSTVAINLNEYFTGEPQSIRLLEALTPVPQVTAYSAGRNTLPESSPILDGKSSSLNLEKGYILAIGLMDYDFQGVGGITVSGMQVWAQGGFY